MAANIRDLRRRIRSVKNTRQLTKAMKMVSAAKLRRAQEAMMAARPYSSSMSRVVSELTSRAGESGHPLLAQREGNNVDVIIIAGDKGLCGSFNSTVFRAATEKIEDLKREGKNVNLILAGKKTIENFNRYYGDLVIQKHTDITKTTDYALAAKISASVRDRFVKGETDAVYVVYNEFKSMIAQTLRDKQLLPIQPAESEGSSTSEYIYEPSEAALLDLLLPRYVSVQIFQGMMESVAAEHASRMTAMDAATRNAGEMIDKLTLIMNRARQAAITTEIIEVVSGAEALG